MRRGHALALALFSVHAPLFACLERFARQVQVARHAGRPEPQLEIRSGIFIAFELWRWLEDNGAKGLENVEIIEGANGCGLFARRDFSKSQVVVSIPSSLCLQADDGHDRPEVAAAAALLREKRLGSSKFQAYLESLPRSLQHPAVWPQMPWRQLLGPAALRRVRLARMRAAAGSAALLDAGLADSQEEARWALATVRSRAFPAGRGMMLCPLLDLLNHYTVSSGGPTCGFIRFGKTVGMVAEREVKTGEELCHLYALAPSSELLASYGFVPKGGAGGFEEALIEVPAHDFGGPLGEACRAALRRRNLGRGLGLGRPLLLRLFGNVGSSLLLPVARLLSLPTVEEIGRLETEILDNWQELPDLDLEQRACALAAAWLEVQRDRNAALARQQVPQAGIQRAAAELASAENVLIMAALDWAQARQQRLASAGG
ncbi:unnamed protein product [Effrenium voratum]|nr:unnamed protein product [Effrenium voratum]